MTTAQVLDVPGSATASAGTASPLIRLHAHDNVLVAREPLELGRELPEFGLRLRAQVPAGHKIAARAIAQGERVRKYDVVIGVALRDIAAGEHVHGHNLTLVDEYRDPAFGADVRPVSTCPRPSVRASWASCGRTRAAKGRWPRATSSASWPR